MTITASLPTDGMQTRAEGDDSGDATATRCYMQILNGDGTELAGGNSKPIKMDPDGKSFTTTVYLNGTNTYDFLFWADTEATDAAAPADLRAVEYTNGKTIAWAGNDLDKMWDADGVSKPCRFPCDRDNHFRFRRQRNISVYCHRADRVQQVQRGRDESSGRFASFRRLYA